MAQGFGQKARLEPFAPHGRALLCLSCLLFLIERVDPVKPLCRKAHNLAAFIREHVGSGPFHKNRAVFCVNDFILKNHLGPVKFLHNCLHFVLVIKA